MRLATTSVTLCGVGTLPIVASAMAHAQGLGRHQVVLVLRPPDVEADRPNQTVDWYCEPCRTKEHWENG